MLAWIVIGGLATIGLLSALASGGQNTNTPAPPSISVINLRPVSPPPSPLVGALTLLGALIVIVTVVVFSVPN
ncbi:MAG: hypothetical protein ACE5H9_17835 [Anaerolineae bacterium]